MAIAAIWGIYALNRLWQQHLAEIAAGALAEAARLGLAPMDPRFGPRQVFSGDLGGRALRVEWRGGLLGERTVLIAGGRAQVLPLICDAEGLRAALGAEAITPGA